MLHLELKLNPQVEQQFKKIVAERYNGSYEKFIESVVIQQENVLSKLGDISEDLGIDDLVSCQVNKVG